jgi:hypothetical protein
MRARLLSAGLGLAVFWGSQAASAYCLTHGCNERTQACAYEGGCLVSGPVLHWPSSCVSFDLQQDGSPLRGLHYADAHEALLQAFGQWLNADCGDGQKPNIKISDYGPVECREAEYNQDAPNANIVMFRDDSWPYQNAIDTLALTTLIFNAESGAIYDADVEVNTYQTQMSVGAVGPSDIDFHSVITHEIGHFLGLSHSNAFGSTMSPSYDPGQTGMASIEFDDEQGICAALPADRKVTSKSCEPRHGFSSECALPATHCSVGSAPAGGWASLALGAAALSGVLLRRRRARL